MSENEPQDPEAATGAFRRRPREWRKLRSEVETCQACELCEHATQAVFGRGPLGAEIVMVGAQPDDHDDQEGVPFSGPPGEVLARAMVAADIDRDAVYFTHAVKHFRFELRGRRRLQRSPEQHHVDACRGWLESELTLVSPRLVVLLGSVAVRAVAPGIELRRDHGQVFEVEGRHVLATLDPSAVLRVEERQLAFRTLVSDLEAARGFCDASRRRRTAPMP
jgi:DNA polymerase